VRIIRSLLVLILIVPLMPPAAFAQDAPPAVEPVPIPTADEIEAVELLIAAPSTASMASIAGHLYLLLRRKNDISGLSTVIGFVANSSEDERSRINTCLYSLRGLFGHYRSLVQRERLITVIIRNTIAEDRDIHRLRLNLTRGQLERLLAGIAVMEETLPDERYYFINRNCTSFLFRLLRDVYRDEKRPADIEWIDMPLNVARKIYQYGLAEFVYPEYPSISRAAADAWKRIGAWLAVKPDAGNDKADFSAVFRERLHFFQRRISRLDRIPFYRNLLDRFSQTWPEGERAASPRFLEQGRQLLAFFEYAKAIERYREYRDKLKKKDAENLIKTEAAENRMLIELSLRLRGILVLAQGERFSASWEQWRQAESDSDRGKRAGAAILSGYSVVSLAGGIAGTGRHASAEFEYSLLRQRLGDGSLFAANRHSRLDLLAVRHRFSAAPGDYNRTTLIRFEKIIKKKGPSNRLPLRPGFGILFFEEERDPHPLIARHTDLARLSILLNLFEAGNFRHYFLVEAGTGFALTRLQAGDSRLSGSYLGGMETKIQIGRGYRSELRGSLQYIRYSGWNGFRASRLLSEAEWNWTPFRLTGLQFFLSYGFEHSHWNPVGGGVISADQGRLQLGLRGGFDLLSRFR